jgi:SpoVK/Ycf46/Vps4 family AAA+-type ATPase
VLEAARQAAPAAVLAKKIIPLKMDNFLAMLKTLKPSVTFDMLDDYEKFRVDFERRGAAVSEEPVVEAPQIKWTDVIGLDDVKQALKEAIELPLLHEEELKKYKVKPAKGVLMFGPPGCGKTLLARAASNELKATFISLTPADISRRGYDQAVSLIKEVFNRGRENAPAIIFIDEIESIAPARGYTSSKAVEDMVAQMLQELDGMKELKNVVLVGATNRPDIIDKALLRPGRFDKIVFVSPPDKKGRRQIFIKNLDGIDGSDTVDYDKLAEIAEGFTGADISGVCQEVKLELVRRKIAGEDEPKATTEALEAVITRRTPSVTVDMLKQYLTFVKEFGERR